MSLTEAISPKDTALAHVTAPAEAWFAAQGWTPRPFQREVWARYLSGESGLLHAPTGTGKTLAVALGPMLEARAQPTGETGGGAPPIRLLWVTPLRALAADTERALREAAAALDLPWTVERRTSDTGASVRQRQRVRLPTALVTTPESLAVLLSHPAAVRQLGGLRAVVVDEWHELLGSKRGVLTELALARLRGLAPGLRTWGLSATLGNLDEACAALLGIGVRGALVAADETKSVLIESALPEVVERFPWAGHLGLALLPRVVAEIEASASTLVFVNTRRQAERWFQALLEARPDWAGVLGLHHASLARATRRFVERALREGRLRAVVATSSLDLGVDFPPVDRVVQIGSPKGVGRLLQRAGRSGHRPGQASRVLLVPTHAFELVEAAAARRAAARGRIEPRRSPSKPLDLLVQHILTVALGAPFEAAALRDEVRSAWSYGELTDAEWAWALAFAASGGPALRAYPEFARLVEVDGRWMVTTDRVAARHRRAIGTIVSDAEVEVVFQRGGRLGTLPEHFVARLEPGDAFVFAGRTVELVRLRDLKAVVRRARTTEAVWPAFTGGRMPLSTELGAAVRDLLARAARGQTDDPELEAVRPILALQARWSRIPAEDELLVERTRSREGHHLFVFPFEGRLAHEGMAALVAHRLARRAPAAFAVAFNDYGFELLTRDASPTPEALAAALLETEHLEEDLRAAVNAAELARRRFREIARVAGLLTTGLPGQGRSARQLQMSSGLLFDVFARHDPGNRLLRQAEEEALHELLALGRIRTALERWAAGRLVVVETPRVTPLAFPIFAERLAARVGSTSVADRIRAHQLRLERAAG